MSITKTSISRPVTITMLFIGIAFLGLFAFSKLGIGLLPNVNIPRLVVQTNYPNAVPEEIEKLVTEPLESAIGTVTGVKRVTSVSKEGISVISIDFLWGTDIDMAVLSLREKLDNVRFSLPKEAGRPTIIRSNPNSTPIISLVLQFSPLANGQNSKFKIQNSHSLAKGLTSNFTDHNSSEYQIKRLIELKEAARVIFRRRFEQLNGVAQAVVTGGLEREILIEVNPQKLNSYKISFGEIESAIKSANISMPAGSIMKGLFRYSIRTLGEFNNLDEIKNTVIKYSGSRAILLSDIAEVKDNFKEREGLTRLNGSETVGLLIYKEADANTVSIAKNVKETIKTLQKEYPDFNIIIATDQSGFIEDAIENVKQEILYGGVLAVLVLFFFLGNLRNVFIIGITIPASLVLTVLLMYIFEIDFNIISLGGIAVGVGMLLDNAIIVIENIVRYREQGYSIIQSAIKGSDEVAMPIVAATLTTIVVFLPLIFVKGIAGELFKDQSYAIAFSLTSSIFVAVTLIPMLASRDKYLKNYGKIRIQNITIQKPEEKGLISKIKFWIKFPFLFIVKSLNLLLNNFLVFLTNRVKPILDSIYKVSNNFLEKIILYYEKLLEWSLKNKKTVLVLSALLMFITILALLDIKKEFIPQAEQDEFVVELNYPKGTSLKGNALLTSEVEKTLLINKKVKNVISNIGLVNEFDFFNKEQHSVNKTNLIVKLDSYKSYYKVKDYVIRILSNIGVTTFSFKQQKTAYSEIINPAENDIEIKIKNKNYDEAYNTALSLIEKLNNKKIYGIKNYRLNSSKGIQEYRLTIDENKCNEYGINISNVVDRISFLVKGKKVTLFSDFDKKVAINLKTQNEFRDDIDKILNEFYKNKGVSIQLKDLMKVELVNTFNEIWREDQSRTVYVYADVYDIDVNEAVSLLNNEIENFPKTLNQIITVGGANEEILNSFSQLYIAFIIFVFLMYMILAMEFESFLFPFIIIISVPLGLIGGVLSLYLLGESISIISIMGLIILVGIADNDAVVKVEFILRKRKEGLNIHDAIMQAGQDRFRPIVMNSLTVMFALIPMIIGIGAGTQLRISLSIAIAGGLFSATILTLIIVPVLYTYMEKWSKKEF